MGPSQARPAKSAAPGLPSHWWRSARRSAGSCFLFFFICVLCYNPCLHPINKCIYIYYIYIYIQYCIYICFWIVYKFHGTRQVGGLDWFGFGFAALLLVEIDETPPRFTTKPPIQVNICWKSKFTGFSSNCSFWDLQQQCPWKAPVISGLSTSGWSKWGKQGATFRQNVFPTWMVLSASLFAQRGPQREAWPKRGCMLFGS